ncbi:hypothetical protein BK659_18530 [Pseudomonas brassicacearum]|uniref:Uncharacterized protein n=1 Tax=Pseudomonas brassicacearum TaxID=930166 RepID=A0A423H445_9PSED|nr:hypothetical protein [Pseudomonas brassicacearum]RON07537.1 hypothetical protein BK659_18530 [Pseudomonas brassicacearum]
MNTVYVDGVYIGKAKNLGQGLLSDTDKQRIANRLWLWPQGTRTGRLEDWSSRLLGLPLEGLRA